MRLRPFGISCGPHYWARSIMLLTSALALVACTGKTQVPDSLGGVWTQANDDSIRLKFVPTTVTDPGGVFLSISKSAAGQDWFGPLVLRQSGKNRWKFALETIKREEGNTLTILQPPSASKDPEYLIVQGGNLLVRASTHLVKPGEPVGVRIVGADLIATGLWVRQETQKWDNAGQPVKQTVARIETKFVKGS
jgi:hypothetical protein